MFPISRDPPEGGTQGLTPSFSSSAGFQFLGIPPKGERSETRLGPHRSRRFPISRDPPEGGTSRRRKPRTGLPCVSNF